MSKTVQRLETKESIDERTQRVLRGIIEGYITSNEPVGSRSLSKTLEMGLSPATIRNIMSDLSDMGFLMQLHIQKMKKKFLKSCKYAINISAL